MMGFELERQGFHAAMGVVSIAMLLLIGRDAAMALVFAVLVAGTLVMNARILGMGVPVIEGLERRLEREDAPLPGWGSACYAAGALMIIAFLGDSGHIAAGLFILAFGDSASTIVGTWRGRTPLPHNKRKSAEGMLAFFLVSLASWHFIGPAAVPLAAVAAAAETLPGIEDNLSIPVACVAFFMVLL